MAQSTRTKRRIVGMAAKRLGEARLDEILDPRDPRGRRWALPALLSGALIGLMAGCRSLKAVEELTDELTLPVRRKLGIGRRIPDTTLRDALSMLAPDDLRPVLHRPRERRVAARRSSPTDCPSASLRWTARTRSSRLATTSSRSDRHTATMRRCAPSPRRWSAPARGRSST